MAHTWNCRIIFVNILLHKPSSPPVVYLPLLPHPRGAQDSGALAATHHWLWATLLLVMMLGMELARAHLDGRAC